MKRWIIVTVAIVAVALPTAILAEPLGKMLEGKYSGIGSRVCVQSPYGFSGEPAPSLFEPDFRLKVNANVRSTHYKGKLELDRDGTGTFALTSTQIYHQKLSIGDRPLGVWTGSCEVNYHMLSDDNIEIEFVDCNGRGGIGIGSGNESGGILSKMSLEVSSSKDVLLLADTELLIETTWSLPAGWEWGSRFQSERVCTRAFTAVRVR